MPLPPKPLPSPFQSNTTPLTLTALVYLFQLYAFGRVEVSCAWLCSPPNHNMHGMDAAVKNIWTALGVYSEEWKFHYVLHVLL